MIEIKNNEIMRVYGLVVIAFFFSIAVRMIWVFMMINDDSFIWNGQMMINTNDGYFWAEGARDILSGVSQENDRSPIEYLMSQITAFFAYLLPFSFESVILYLPAVLSSLIVIPVILIGRSLGSLSLGFIAALISAIAWSYYNRTMVGYFDTDMLNIVIPIFLLWSLVLAFQTKKDKYLLIMALDIIIYRAWYPQSYSLEFATFALLLGYYLIYDRKSDFTLKLLIIMLVAMVNLPSYARILLVLALFYYYQRENYSKHLYVLLGISVLLFFLTGGFDPIWLQLKKYVFSSATSIVEGNLSLHYFSVGQTISEAGKIPFDRFADRISGHVGLFLLSILGFVLLVKRYNVMLLALPLVGLGFMAYGIPGIINGGGLRFTIYAIVPMAFGLAYLFLLITHFILNNVSNIKRKKTVYFTSLAVLTVIALVPHIQHVVDYKVPTVMTAEEVKVLDKLHNIANVEDYVVTWWDYGYPVRYYADVKTLADGGKQSGQANYPVSLALTKPQNISAKIARITVEANELISEDDLNKTDHFVNLLVTEKINSVQGFYDFLELENDNFLLKPTRDIYYYLPFRMSSIYPVVESFRNIDIFSGEKLKENLFRSFSYHNLPDRFELSNGLYFSKRDGKLYQGDKIIPLRMFYQSHYNKLGKIEIKKQLLNMSGSLNLLFLPNYGRIILLDDHALNSTYVQLFFFENYDKNYFEPVILSPVAKVFKLKI